MNNNSEPAVRRHSEKVCACASGMSTESIDAACGGPLLVPLLVSLGLVSLGEEGGTGECAHSAFSWSRV